MIEMPRIGDRKHFLLDEHECVRTWYDELLKGSKLTADAYQRRLGFYCESVGVDPSGLLLQDQKHQSIQMKKFIDGLQGSNLPSYIKSLEKGVRSFYSFHGIDLPRVKYDVKRGARLQEDKGLERIPTHEEIRKLLRDSTPRVRVMVALMAHSGLRPGVLGDVTGQFGLCLRDLPELVISNDDISFIQTPCIVRVPASLSKTHSSYPTFLSSEGCDLLSDYLRDRIKKGEVLRPESPIIRTIISTNAKNRFPCTKTITADIRRALRKVGLMNCRPYALRIWFSQQLQSAETRGHLTHTQAQLFMGHKPDMTGHYQFNGKVLAPEIVDELRSAYKRSEELLIISAPRTSQEMINAEVRKALLETKVLDKLSERGIEREEILRFIDKYRIRTRSFEEVDKLIEEKYPPVPEASQEMKPDSCPGCDGAGIQVDKDGIRVLCPICKGSGRWVKPLE